MPPVEIVDSLEDLMDDMVSIDKPLDYQFLGTFVSSFHAQHLAEIVGDAAEATQKIIETARDDKEPDHPVYVVPMDEDIYIDDDPVSRVVLVGYVRLDTPESYEAFRTGPEMHELVKKVSELEEILNTDMADGNGGEELVGEYLSDISRLQVDADEDHKRIPFSLPPWAGPQGEKWDCWREGNMICCSIMLPGPDGDVRICTSATPVDKYALEVAGYTHEAGYDVPELLGVLPTIACMMGGSYLMPRMASAAPALLARPEAQGRQPFFGKLLCVKAK